MPHPIAVRSCRVAVVLPLTFTALVLAGCQARKPPGPSQPQALDYARELPAGEKALRKIPPEQYPDFSGWRTNPADLARSIDNSLAYLSAPSSGAFFPYLDITRDRAVATLRAMRHMLATPGGPDWNALVRQKFEVYQSVGAPKPDDAAGYTGQVLFTGYYTPICDASPTRSGPFQWPLYKKPADLPPAAGGPDGAAGGGARYYTRAEIERDGRLAGQELVWLRSRWEAYVVTVQGSGRLRMPDGRLADVGYAGTNGHPYVSPGKRMVDDGVIPKDQLSFFGLRRYFDAHPEAMDRYLLANPRTTFFTFSTGGIRGCLNVPVTAFATLATDKDVYPRAMPAFVVTRVPSAGGTGADSSDSSGYRGFMLDQDAGGAIRAAGRCDLYMGVGPDAEQSAGRQLYPGQLYYLALKPEWVPQYLGAGPPTVGVGRTR